MLLSHNTVQRLHTITTNIDKKTKPRTFIDTAQQSRQSRMIDTKKEFVAEDPELSEDTGEERWIITV